MDELGPPSRDFGYDLAYLATSPGARKEQTRSRQFSRRAAPAPLPYVELRTASAFSFLAGSSLPEDLIAAAATAGLPAVALLDRAGVYGAPRFHKAAQQAGIRAIVGAELPLTGVGAVPTTPILRSAQDADSHPRLSLLAASRVGYRHLCRLLTAAARDRPKGQAALALGAVEPHSEGLVCLTGGDEGPLAEALANGGIDAAAKVLERLQALFPNRLWVELQRHRRRDEEHRNRALVDLARRYRLPLVATNGVRYALPSDKPLHDVLTCIRHHSHLDAAGRLLGAERERHVKGAAEMAALFADLPRAVAASAELAASLDFTLADLGYRFPEYPLPPGETAASYLRHVTWNAARARFRPLTGRAQDQLAKELQLIEKLELAGYFLIVWDIVRFCQREGILAQGRGSAANSAVCYALSITAVDPVKMELLFERFLSEERGEWPDIDLDLPSGDQRERVIQYVYQRYGPHGAAMTANVITYRDRSAAREVGKALGYGPEQVDRLSKQLGGWSYDMERGDPKVMAGELQAAGFDPGDHRIQLFAEHWRRIQNLPRHLGQHSGGMVIAAGRLDEVVPLEPAAMPGRVVVQWDKDDCADLGIIKVDLLGLGMLQVLEDCIPLIQSHEGIHVDLAHLPPDDPPVYAMLRRADTVGVFQVESRAQMASLPRNAPTRFYDLVIQVAIIRPGPIMGGMIHPFFERRLGREVVTYPHPCLEPILRRTLGVPIFQEQILRMAMAAAGFSGGEAEELRRAMGFKRSRERMQSIEERLREGMAARGIVGAGQDQIVLSITSFALYGFPESHAASFALIAYASAYLKHYHPTAFLIALLNAWPMGFYHPATLIKDAERHGVTVLPIDVARSDWRCKWEGTGNTSACRLGMRYLRGLRQTTADTIVGERTVTPFANLDDLARRCRLQRDELSVLAASGALAGFGLSRRGALWQAARVARPVGPLFAEAPVAPAASPLTELSPLGETAADYATTGVTTGTHPLRFLRPTLRAQGVKAVADLPRVADGERVAFAGAVIVRQRPGTAKGVLFMTLEDETGMAQAIVAPELMRAHRQMLVSSAGLVVEGILQHRDGAYSVRAERFRPLPTLPTAPSHDFR